MFLQTSPGPDGNNVAENKDDDGDKDKALGVDQVALDSFNRSSSFLFDSLYDSSLLAALGHHQVSDQSDEEDSEGQHIRGRGPLLSTQERRRSELLANQEAEQQEAIQWGESSFNLSEWGDSLLVGEHFLEKQSLLKHTERSQREASHCKDQHPKLDHVLPEEQSPKPSHIQPQPTTSAATMTQSEHNNQSNTHLIKQHSNEQNDNELDGRQEIRREDGEEMSAVLSDKILCKHPHEENASESTFYCSPGLQEIFDRWPSMSDQPCQNTTLSHASNTAELASLPQSSIQGDTKRGNVPTSASKSNSPEAPPLRHDCEDVTERPGSAGDLIPPTQETPPVTPRVKLTTSSIQSPLTAPPLNQSTPSTNRPQKPAITRCPKPQTGRSDAVSTARQPNTTPNRSHKHREDHRLKSNPAAQPSSKTKTQQHMDQNLRPPCNRTSPSTCQPEPPCDVDSSVIKQGFSLHLSQDASLCSSNAGTFSIIDLASNRHLFETFISEWKTKERYSLALACGKTENRQQPAGEIGEKHQRGQCAEVTLFSYRLTAYRIFVVEKFQLHWS